MFRRTVISLPVVHMGKSFCGGNVIVAKEDKRPVDGSLLEIQVLDNMGTACGNQGNMTDADITITEMGARDSHEVVSSITAVVAR